MKKNLILLGSILILGAGAVSLEEVFVEKETKVLFVGDMMFDRTVRKRMEANGADSIFACVSDHLSKYDAVFGNLEGPITKNASVNLDSVPGGPNNMTFTFPLEVAGLLYKNNFKAVSLANNHIFDFGKSGVEETRKSLSEAKVGWFGDPVLPENKTFIYENKLALVGFNQFLGVDSVEGTVKEIERIKNSEYGIKEKMKIIVFAHWGEEYVEANRYQKLQAHQFIDAGADLVLGAHPHVIQESEVYKGKQIYYSLGNFIFDQWWTESVRRGMGVEVTLKDGLLTTNTLQFESSRDGRTCLVK